MLCLRSRRHLSTLAGTAPKLGALLLVGFALLSSSCSSSRSRLSDGESAEQARGAQPQDPEQRRIAELERRIARLQSEGEPATVALLEAELGELYLEESDLRRARRNFRLARYDAPREERVRRRVALGLGEVYLREGQPELAVDELEPLAKERGELSAQDELRFRAYLSLAYERTGKSAEAQKLRPSSFQEKEFLALRRRAGESGAPVAPLTSPTKPPVSTTPGLAFQVLPRSSWRASNPRDDQSPMGAVRRITIHHSAMEPTSAPLEDAAKQIRSIQSGHFQRGYADIGYHYLIDSQGRIWEGRDKRFQGAHAGNTDANERNLGICLLGNFVSVAPTPAQDRALRILVDAERARYRVSKDQVFGHGEVRKYFTGQSTECPGERLMTVVRDLRGGRAGNLADDE
ncbi:MAG: N-acetylmuramoyl-L-alanine amidase [Planctomycetes bacterium]|nr:N-acetylmuramoyl-L-alanine amidase [Planctomycetota bacterium]